MTDQEMLIIKRELYKAYASLTMLPIEKRYVGAVMMGLNNAQKILNNQNKKVKD
jgi:hypothetical protein